MMRCDEMRCWPVGGTDAAISVKIQVRKMLFQPSETGKFADR